MRGETGEALYRVEESGVGWVTLNRPESGNAVSPDQRIHIPRRLEEAGEDLCAQRLITLVNSALESTRDVAFRDEALSVEICIQAEDGEEGVRSFPRASTGRVQRMVIEQPVGKEVG